MPPGPAESCGGNALYRRNVLEVTGGFDETLIAGEEADLCYRIRHDHQQVILSLDEPMVRHDIDMTRAAQYWKRCVRTGHAYAEVGGRHRGMHRWRVARWRNLVYALCTPFAVGLSFALSSILPVAVWIGLVALVVMRNAWRLRLQVGSLGGALLYSSHHYLCKTPAALGQCVFWVRSALGRKPQTLIEYR